MLIEFFAMLALLVSIACIIGYCAYSLVSGTYRRRNTAIALFILPALGIIGFIIYALVVLNY